MDTRKVSGAMMEEAGGFSTRTALIRETDGYFFPTLAALARDASILMQTAT